MDLEAGKIHYGAADSASLFGVVDIGSNSVRLVVFDLEGGHPAAVFNDREFCSLGKGVGETGTLSDEGRAQALRTVVRYVGIARALGVERLELIATAALRDAVDGEEFSQLIRSETGCPVTIVSGDEEARLAARGVAYATPRAHGLVGDLGNGSLELVEIDNGEIGNMVSLPVGSLRIMSQFGGDLAAARAEAVRQLESVGWLAGMTGRSFYPVGGAWRMLCRIHMEQVRAPLHIIHAYSMPASMAHEFATFLSRLGSRTLARIPAVQSRRLDMVQISSEIFGAVIGLGKPKTVMFSAAGLREGVVVERAGDLLADDPLVAAADDMGARMNRAGAIGPAFFEWMKPLFPRPKTARDRLRYVSAALSDIGWREHPDYRARQSMLHILRQPFLAIDHPSRASVAWTMYVRYGGKPDNPDADTVAGMLSNRALKRAEVVGRALRLAHRLSGSTPALLVRSRLEARGGALHLHVPDHTLFPPDDRLSGPLKNLADAAGMTAGGIVR